MWLCGTMWLRCPMRLCRPLHTSGGVRLCRPVRLSGALRARRVTAALGCRDFDFLLRRMWLRDRRRYTGREAEGQGRRQTCCYFCHAESSTRGRQRIRASWS
jgi:hypothetical protein